MSKKWLVLDATNLCHRAWHTTGSLSHGGQQTGVTFGFLREILSLQERHGTKDFIFCFDRTDNACPLAKIKGNDSSKCKRSILHPGYKSARKEKYKNESEEEKESRKSFHQEVKCIRDKYLYDLGYNNVFWQKGYEADDLIATTVIKSIPPEDTAIIVSGDKDLYQLLRKDKVSIWKPVQKCFYTEKDLSNQFFDLSPQQWHAVKAIAGCPSDSVVGVPGVGEITAAKFITGVSKSKTLYDKIMEHEKLWLFNQTIVRLPYLGTKVFEIYEDEVTDEKWKSVTKKLGIDSLVTD